jgi:hypothetical protein
MPKKPVKDPITEQEMIFVHLLSSGTMTDREAAQAAGLNPETASYTKAKPRVQAYMEEHRAAVAEKLAAQAAEALHKQNLSRDRVLDRLWELASLPPETTRGNIAGQIKAMAMIVAIQGLIPDRRHPAPQTQATVQPSAPPFYQAEWVRQAKNQQNEQPANPEEPVPAAQATPAPKPETEETPSPDPIVIDPEKQNWVPEATGSWEDAARAIEPLPLSLSMKNSFFRGRRH